MMISDVDAFKQAIEPFIEEYNITRTAKPGYDERGRVADVRKKDTVKGFIEPGGKSINTNPEGNGRWVKADFTIYCIVPQYVSMGDLIFTPNFGTLKVHSINDLRCQGVMSASLVRTGTSDPSVASDNRLYEDYD